VVLAETDEIGVGEFPQIATQLARDPSGAGENGCAKDEAGPGIAPPAPGFAGTMAIRDDHATGLGGSVAASGVPAGTLQLTDPAGEVRPLEEVETEVIRFAVTHYRGQMSEVARRLRIGRSTLYRKLDLLGLEADAPEADNQSAIKAL
jgi:DNA-binding NtrC family response regulator